MRYAWLAEDRAPVEGERATAIDWTTGVWASEQVRTARKTESSRRQEAAVADVLRAAGYEHSAKRRVTSLDEMSRGSFGGEAVLAGAKADVPVRLHDGRLLAIECKVSNSAVNSVKRLLRETGGKAHLARGLWPAGGSGRGPIRSVQAERSAGRPGEPSDLPLLGDRPIAAGRLPETIRRSDLSP